MAWNGGQFVIRDGLKQPSFCVLMVKGRSQGYAVEKSSPENSKKLPVI